MTSQVEVSVALEMQEWCLCLPFLKRIADEVLKNIGGVIIKEINKINLGCSSWYHFPSLSKITFYQTLDVSTKVFATLSSITINRRQSRSRARREVK